MPVEVECDYCGKTFEKKPSKVRDRNYCSLDCYGKWESENRVGENHPNWKGKSVLTCPTCGEEFEVKPHEKDRRKYCSIECMAEGYKERLAGENHPSWEGGKAEVECDWCGKVFEKKPSHVMEHNFCSQECMGKWRSKYRSGENHPDWEGGKREVNCEWCGKPVKVCRSKAENQEHIFCSQDCYLSWRSENLRGEDHPSWKGKVELECDQCGKRIEKKPSAVHDHNFCSRECFFEWISENQPKGEDHSCWEGGKAEVECDWCGEKIEVKRYETEEFDHHFCSKECMGKWRSEYLTGEDNPAWKGGKEPYYGPNWYEQRKKTLKRDNHTCQLCGAEEDGRKHDVHHITPLRKFEDYEKANSLDNLITLCRDCHNRAEHGEITKEELRKLAQA